MKRFVWYKQHLFQCDRSNIDVVICGCICRLHRQIHRHLGWKVHDQAAEEYLRENPWQTGGQWGPAGFLQVQMLDMRRLVNACVYLFESLGHSLLRKIFWADKTLSALHRYRNPLDFTYTCCYRWAIHIGQTTLRTCSSFFQRHM